MTETKTTQSRYQVGSDNETASTVRTEAVSGGAQYVAALWAKFKSDQPFDRVFWENGMRVQVIIRQVKEEHTGKDALK